MKTIIIFMWLVSTGYIISTNEKNEGRNMYTVILPNDKVYKNAYKQEIFKWIRTGEFKYNDFKYEKK